MSALGRYKGRRPFEDLAEFVRLSRHFKEQVARQKGALVVALLAAIFYAGVKILEPWPIKIVLDSVLIGSEVPAWLEGLAAPFSGGKTALLLVTCAGIVLIGAAAGLGYYLQSYLTEKVGQAVVFGIRGRLFSHLQRLSLGFHTEKRAGDILVRLTGDINMLKEMLVGSVVTITTEFFLLFGILAVMLWLDWRLTLVALLMLPALLALTVLYTRRMKLAARQQRRREGDVASVVQESLSAINVVQVFTRERHEEERYEEHNQRSVESGLDAARYEARMTREVEVVFAVGTAVFIFVGANRVLAGSITPGELVVFVSYLRNVQKPLRRLARLMERISKATAATERIVEVLEEEPDVRDLPHARPAPRFGGRVAFEGVSFAYGGDGSGREAALEDIDLVAEPGERVAVIGPTGSGKSTLVSLIPRLYDPTSGRVTIDGRDVRDYTLESLRSQIAVVLQESTLFNISVRENIAYGRPEASAEEILAAARAAHAHEFIERLPQGYDTVIGERGSTLSGGQRQRIAIARALLRDARILVLDEPTTGLDPKSEELVMQALDNLTRGRTTFVIAHSMKTVSNADRIVFIERGRIAEHGTPEELLATSGRYRRFVELQLKPQAARTG